MGKYYDRFSDFRSSLNKPPERNPCIFYYVENGLDMVDDLYPIVTPFTVIPWHFHIFARDQPIRNDQLWMSSAQCAPPKIRLHPWKSECCFHMVLQLIEFHDCLNCVCVMFWNNTYPQFIELLIEISNKLNLQSFDRLYLIIKIWFSSWYI